MGGRLGSVWPRQSPLEGSVRPLPQAHSRILVKPKSKGRAFHVLAPVSHLSRAVLDGRKQQSGFECFLARYVQQLKTYSEGKLQAPSGKIKNRKGGTEMPKRDPNGSE